MFPMTTVFASILKTKLSCGVAGAAPRTARRVASFDHDHRPSNRERLSIVSRSIAVAVAIATTIRTLTSLNLYLLDGQCPWSKLATRRAVRGAARATPQESLVVKTYANTVVIGHIIT